MAWWQSDVWSRYGLGQKMKKTLFNAPHDIKTHRFRHTNEWRSQVISKHDIGDGYFYNYYARTYNLTRNRARGIRLHKKSLATTELHESTTILNNQLLPNVVFFKSSNKINLTSISLYFLLFVTVTLTLDTFALLFWWETSYLTYPTQPYLIFPSCTQSYLIFSCTKSFWSYFTSRLMK